MFDWVLNTFLDCITEMAICAYVVGSDVKLWDNKMKTSKKIQATLGITKYLRRGRDVCIMNIVNVQSCRIKKSIDLGTVGK